MFKGRRQSDGLLEGRRSFEAHRLSGFDLDGFAGTRIQSLPRFGLYNPERTEARKCGPCVLLHLLDDRRNQVGGGTMSISVESGPWFSVQTGPVPTVVLARNGRRW